MRKFIILTLFNSVTIFAGAQRITAEEYITQYRDIAVREMIRMGVPAAVTLAQGLLETECGNSELFKKSNNHFGIKCKNTWTGASVSHDDDASGECFRVYPTSEESYRDHSNFLRGNDRYRSLFSLDPADYKGWAYGLKSAGYATNPAYPAILIKNIEQYNLQQYTLYAIRMTGRGDAPWPGNDSLNRSSLKEKALISSGVKDSTEGEKAYVPGRLLYNNQCKCVYVLKGTSLRAVAEKNNISMASLLEFNDISAPGYLGRDQLIYLQYKSDSGAKEFYKAGPDESLYDVAQKTGIRLKCLMDYNKIGRDDPMATGKLLLLKPGITLPQREKKQTAVEKVHTVSAKEGLYSIARRYGVTVMQLREWNKLSSDEIGIGQKIIISQ